MFTGLVDDVGLITGVLETGIGRELRIRCSYRDLVDGESIAVNGVCLTVRERSEAEGASEFVVGAVTTTLGRTDIGAWQSGMRVNLERAMRLGDRLGGHMVLGHVDDVAVVTRTGMQGDAWLIDIRLPAALLPLMAMHGSITVNGVSLTVNALLDDGVQLSIIDYTRQHTTLGELVPGSRVHVEADVLAKHIARLVAPHLAGVMQHE